MAQIKPQQSASAAKPAMSQQRKRIYIAVIVIGNALAFYLIYGQLFGSPGGAPYVPPADPNLASEETTPSQSGTGIRSAFDQLIQDLRVLEDSRFKLLRSLDIQITPPPPGRDNPFN